MLNLYCNNHSRLYFSREYSFSYTMQIVLRSLWYSMFSSNGYLKSNERSFVHLQNILENNRSGKVFHLPYYISKRQREKYTVLQFELQHA